MKRPRQPTPKAQLRAAAKRAERDRRNRPFQRSYAERTLNHRSAFESSQEEAIARNLPRGYLDLEVPNILDLSAAYDSTVHFIEEISRLVFSSSRPLRLIFNGTKEITPTALLMLAAHVSRCRLWKGNNAVTGTYPMDEKLEHLLEDTGFFNLLGVQHRHARSPKTFPLDRIPHMQGTQCEGEDVEKLQAKIFGDTTKLDVVGKAKLYRGVTEAITNVIHHAYPPNYRGRYPVTKNQWWMTGHINRLRKDLVIVLFDLGVTIPLTLPLKYTKEFIYSLLGILGLTEPVDGALIKAAMEIGRSRIDTEAGHRGKGLRQMGEIVEQSGGSLHILSRRGDYTYYGTGADKTMTNERALHGTLIEWRVPLQKFAAFAVQEDENGA